MGIANSIEDLNVEGFTEDVLRRFGSEELDQIIDTSFKAYNAFVESFLTVLHNNLYKHNNTKDTTRALSRTRRAFVFRFVVVISCSIVLKRRIVST